MAIKKFSPMLAPNKLPVLEELTYPLLASYKLDGIRCLFVKGKIVSRSFKSIKSKQLNEKFEKLRLYTEMTGLVLDGEFYNHDIPFQAITSCVMTEDITSEKSAVRWKEMCEERDINLTRDEAMDGIKFNCFDAVNNDVLSQPFTDRIGVNRCGLELAFSDVVKCVEQLYVYSAADVEKLFEIALAEGYEGLILKDPNGRYKCGRGTLNEGLIYKVKPFRTFDAQVIGVEQATEVDPRAEKKVNELGNSVTSKKKGDRILVERASGFVVKYCTECNGRGILLNGDQECKCPCCKEVVATLAGDKSKGEVMTNAKKEEIWANQELYIGRWIEYKGMLIGAKDVPRHPVMTRYRKDLD